MATKRKDVTVPKAYKAGCLEQVNQRSKRGRMAASTLGALVQDLGGIDAISTQQAMLAERATWLHTRLRELEEKYATTGQLDTGCYYVMVNALSGTLSRLGMKRVPKAVQTLASIRAEYAAAEANAP